MKNGADDSTDPTIKVCVRVRPFIPEEIDGSRCDEANACTLCVAMPSKTRCELNGDHIEKELRTFDFDRCYWSHDEKHPLYATQELVYQELGEKLLAHAIQGFNNCIFAYGQTGSGKSFSVLGAKEGDNRGLLPRIVSGLFAHFQELQGENSTCKCLVSFLEIYQEQIRDLLAQQGGTSGRSVQLKVHTHPILGTVIPGLSEAAVGSCEEVLNLVDYGTTMRSVAETAMNSESSRSHCIFTFKTAISREAGPSRLSQTHLVDLAGSERAKRTKATGQHLKEGANINKSLSTLARVISELAKNKKKSQPPFRESNLTFMLKESLCGNSKTIMMAAIAPSTADYHETLSTLKFAQSVKQVQTRAVRNEVDERSIEKQLREELSILREKLNGYEEQKYTDARRLSLAHRRLMEQEKLCMSFGGDWESLLAAERRRNIHRAAVVDMDVSSLQEHFARFAAQQEESSDSDSCSDSESSSDASSEVSGMMPVIDLGEALGDRANNLSSIEIRCRKSQTDRNRKSQVDISQDAMVHADQLTRALKQLMGDIEKARDAACSLSSPGTPQLNLRPVIAVDPAGGQNELLICAKRTGAENYEVVNQAEWLTDKEFQARLHWLEQGRSLGGIPERCATDVSSPSPFSGDAWTLAAGQAREADEAEAKKLRAEIASLRAERDSLRLEVDDLRSQKHLNPDSGGSPYAAAQGDRSRTAQEDKPEPRKSVNSNGDDEFGFLANVPRAPAEDDPEILKVAEVFETQAVAIDAGTILDCIATSNIRHNAHHPAPGTGIDSNKAFGVEGALGFTHEKYVMHMRQNRPKVPLCDEDPLMRVRGMACMAALDLDEALREMDEYGAALGMKRQRSAVTGMQGWKIAITDTSLNTTHEVRNDSLLV